MYCNQDYAVALAPSLKSELNLWVADLGAPKGSPSSAGWGSWVVHQYVQNASVPWGVSGASVSIDRDVLNGSLDAILTPTVQLAARGRLGMTQSGFCFEVSGQNSESVTFQRSVNCQDWFDAGEVGLLNGVGVFNDATANSTPMQFYRVKPPQ